MGVEDIVTGLSRSYLFEGLARSALLPLAESSTIRRLVRGEVMWHAGEAAHELCVVLEGEVKDIVVDVDGNEIVHFVHGPGMTFGEPGYWSEEQLRTVDVVAVGPTSVIRLLRKDVEPFLRSHPAVKDRALGGLASTVRWQTTLISSLLTRPLSERLLLRLLELMESTRQRDVGAAVTPRITQATLAAMIGVSRENVNRALSALALDGSIRLEEGRYVLIDEQRLRQQVLKGWPMTARKDRRYDA